MTRDWELVREILVNLEEKSDTKRGCAPKKFKAIVGKLFLIM